MEQSAYRKVGVGIAIVALPVGAAVTAWTLRQHEAKRNAELEKTFNYSNDVESLRAVDASLIRWREVSAIDTGMQQPTCFTVAPGGQVIIAGEGQLRILSPRGEVLRATTLSAAATAVCADASRVYVAMKERLIVLAMDGSSQQEWPALSQGSHITSIALSHDAVYLADAGRRVGRVLKLGLDGRERGQLAQADVDKDVSGIVAPSPHMDLAVTSDGNVWVANPGRHQLELYSPAGELLRYWGSAGTTIETFLGCCNPSDFALLSDGRIVTAEKGLARVKVYESDGHLQSVVAPPSAFGGNRAGVDLATDAGGRVLLLEPGTHSIRIFEPLAASTQEAQR